MIPVELLLLLLDQLKGEAFEMVTNPGARDAFAFGEAHGAIKTVERMREKINDLIEDIDNTTEE
jgi:hypothetical protein